MDLFLIDGNGPFFRDAPHGRINWSKIPFAHIEQDGEIPADRAERISADFDAFARTVSGMGFNGITLDDVAHLADSRRYPARVRRLIASYRRLYTQLFQSARRHGLGVYLTTDIMFQHRDAADLGGPGLARACGFLEELLDGLFADFPAVRGVITRFGESDGVDVRGDVRSRLLIRTPGEARLFLRSMLPVFERNQRLLVFRTWSVGAHRIGDLIWNRNTFRRVFGRVNSPNLVLSMKYGESDFFRYLPLNRHFFASDHAKLVELQCRREYEGSGEYPAFIGTDYQRYRDALVSAPSVRGIVVWCQTGGWTAFRRLTYVENSSVWNEINTWVTIRLFRDGLSREEALEDWCRHHGRSRATHHVIKLLHLSEDVIGSLLYTDAFAEQKLFFRRLRIPPLLSVFWDQIIISHAMKRILRCFVRDGERQIREAGAAMEKIERMKDLAAFAGLPARDIEFMRDTFAVLAAAREYYFRPFNGALAGRLVAQVERYRASWPEPYTIHVNFERLRAPRRMWTLGLTILLRRRRRYRLIDHLIALRILSRLLPFATGMRRITPKFAFEQAMGMETLFK